MYNLAINGCHELDKRIRRSLMDYARKKLLIFWLNLNYLNNILYIFKFSILEISLIYLIFNTLVLSWIYLYCDYKHQTLWLGSLYLTLSAVLMTKSVVSTLYPFKAASNNYGWWTTPYFLK